MVSLFYMGKAWENKGLRCGEKISPSSFRIKHVRLSPCDHRDGPTGVRHIFALN